jgi:hypothetical protein
LGRTVEKYQTQRKESQKSSTSPQAVEIVGLLKNTLRPNKERNHKRAAHHSIPAFIGRNG